MILNDTLRECVRKDGIVSICSSSKEGRGHIANTWNRYLIITDDEKILIPCFGFHQTEKNVSSDPEIEIVIGSHEVQGKVGMGTGFLIKAHAEFQREGILFDEMHRKCSFANRVLVCSVTSCRQTI